MNARDTFTIGQRIRPSQCALDRKIWITYRGVAPADRRGRVVGFSSTTPTSVRVQWDGNKTSQTVHMDFIELVPEEPTS